MTLEHVYYSPELDELRTSNDKEKVIKTIEPFSVNIKTKTITVHGVDWFYIGEL